MNATLCFQAFLDERWPRFPPGAFSPLDLPSFLKPTVPEESLGLGPVHLGQATWSPGSWLSPAAQTRSPPPS